jgi:DNA-binding NtrC family response regulator
MNILLIEDEVESRHAMADFLRELGHSVVEGRDGDDALDAMAHQEIQLVISDIRMPRISGLELLRQIHTQTNEIKVVLFTGYADVETAVEALRYGAFDYLLKPIDVEELAAVIDRVKAQSSEESSGVRGTPAITGETCREASQSERSSLGSHQGLNHIGIFSDAMKQVFAQASILHTDRSVPVLIEGETGTGKELVARYLHSGGLTEFRAFVDINCAAIAPSLFESEFFGYEQGAFTGAVTKGHKGMLDMAEGGTLFLDEITEIPLASQAKLLRLIQEKEYYRVGGTTKIKSDVRFVCATNRNIEESVAQGEFRKDLYYRLNVARIHIPPLRERKEDILPLAEMFLRQLAAEKGKSFRTISKKSERLLLEHDWPGNVRELRNILERTVLMYDDAALKPSHLEVLKKESRSFLLPGTGYSSVPGQDYLNFALPSEPFSLEELNLSIIDRALKMHRGNKTETARYLKMSRRSLESRVKKIIPSNSTEPYGT